MLPGGVLAITSTSLFEPSNHNNSAGVKFVAARNESDPQALAACQASSLAARRFEWLMGLALTNDGLLACSYDNVSAALYKFAKGGSMDELATVPVLAGPDLGFVRCAVHQQTQRTYAIGQVEDGNHALVILDANLQVVAIVEAICTFDEEEYDAEEYGPIRDVAVHGDQVIVLTSDSHDEGSGLRLLDLDGRFLHTITAGRFLNPWAVTASHGRAFVVDDDDGVPYVSLGKLLYVIDIQSGDILQRVRVDLQGAIAGIRVDGNEIFIADCHDSKVAVLRYAGSEA